MPAPVVLLGVYFLTLAVILISFLLFRRYLQSRKNEQPQLAETGTGARTGRAAADVAAAARARRGGAATGLARMRRGGRPIEVDNNNNLAGNAEEELDEKKRVLVDENAVDEEEMLDGAIELRSKKDLKKAEKKQLKEEQRRVISSFSSWLFPDLI